MSYWIESNDERFSLQLDNFSSKIGSYAVMFGFSAAEVAQMESDSAYFKWSLTVMKRFADTKKGWTGFKDNLRFGGANVTSNPFPPEVSIAPIPDEVAPGVQARFAIMANRIKASGNYTKAIGYALGIEDVVQNRQPVDNAHPPLRVGMNGGMVILQWKKGIYDGIVIEKDSGSGFVVLDKDFHPNFIDPTPIPPGSQSAVWRYRAMYLFKDNRVGQWSDVVAITVGD